MNTKTSFSAAATPEAPPRSTAILSSNARWTLAVSAAAALSLASVATTPAFAQGLHSVRRSDPTYVSRAAGLAQASAGPAVSSANAAFCSSRWAAYDSISGKYMDDEGEWRPCR